MVNFSTGEAIFWACVVVFVCVALGFFLAFLHNEEMENKKK